MGTQYLEVRGLTVDFDGFKAVSDVDLTLFQGDLRFLIGPNGAGKTTVIDAITGLVSATGSVSKSGVELLGKKVHQIARRRRRPHVPDGQRVRAADGAAEPRHRRRRGPVGVDAAAAAAAACCPSIEEALEIIGLTDLADKPAGVLAHGQKQWLEIGMLLVQNADVLLLDEPVAGMSAEEREETGNLLRRIGGERTVVVVEHDMDFMRAFATSVTVLARGQVIAEGSVAEVQANPKVQEVYLGTAAAGAD